MPSAPGASCSRSTGRRWPSRPRRWTTASSRPRRISSRRSAASRPATSPRPSACYRRLARAGSRARLDADQPGRRPAAPGAAGRCAGSADAALAAERDSVDALLHRATALAQLGQPERRWQRLPAPARHRPAPRRGVERARHRAARSRPARTRPRTRFARRCATARDAELNDSTWPRSGRRRARAAPPPPTSPACSTATPTSSTATSSARCATRRIASWSISWSRPAATTRASARRSTSAAGRGCAARWCGRWPRG